MKRLIPFLLLTACAEYSTPDYTIVIPANQDYYVGCYTDTSHRALPLELLSTEATVETCRTLAKANGMAYAGLQYGGQCFAGNTLGYSKDSDAACDMPCKADAHELCGGTWHNSIYSTGN